MRIKLRIQLLIINLATILFAIVIFLLPSSVVRIILGLPFVLFIPGYILLAALFPKGNQLSGVERVALSFGLSMTVVPLMGFILNYTAAGISLFPMIMAIASFIFLASLIALFRQRKLSGVESLTFRFRWTRTLWVQRNLTDKITFGVFCVAIICAVSVFVYVLTVPRPEEKFTEYYMLGTAGFARDYPVERQVGESTSVIVVVINHEHEMVNYRIELTLDGLRKIQTNPIPLEDGGKWQQTLTFSPTKVGNDQKIEILLYKNKEKESYLKPLYFWINVVPTR